MTKYYMTCNPFTLTDIDTFETKTYEDFETIINKILLKACDVYIYDLDKLAKPIIGRLFELEYFHIPSVDLKNLNQQLERKQFTTIGTYDMATNQNDMVMIRSRRTLKAHTRIFNARKLFGAMPIKDIIKSVESSNEYEGMALAINGLHYTGLNAWTLSGNALKDLKQRCFGKTHKGRDISDIVFRDTFPELYPVIHDFCISAYQGGICYFNPKYKQQKIVAHGTEYDVNSMYPSIMLNEYLPYGMPIPFEGKYIPARYYPFYFQQIKIKSIKLKPNGIPCIKRRKKNGYYMDDKDVTVVLTGIDIELMFDNYDVDIEEYQGGYMFQGRKKMFDEYINHWANEKIEATKQGDKFRRTIAKLMLNSAYGKFASRTDRKPNRYKVLTDGTVARTFYGKAKDKKEGMSVYAPVGCYITAYARRRLIKAIKSNWEHFLYSDTDSIYLLGDQAHDLDIHETELGKWKKEFTFNKMYIVGKKQYIVAKEDNTHKIACAGMPIEVLQETITFDDFKLGNEFQFKYKVYDKFGIEHWENAIYRLKDEKI